MLSLILAAALEFTAQDAKLAFDRAAELVEKCTPRDAGTISGRIAAHRILDAASATGADVRRDMFRARTPTGMKDFTNLYAEFKCGDEDARWVVVISHYDTKPGAGCPGDNDGASTSGLLIGLANAFSNWRKPKGNLMLVWTDGEECMTSYSENDGEHTGKDERRLGNGPHGGLALRDGYLFPHAVFNAVEVSVRHGERAARLPDLSEYVSLFVHHLFRQHYL